MAAAAALLVAALILPGHSRSEGRARLSLDDQGQVDIEITLSEADLPELCDADLSSRDRALAEQKLIRCLERDLPLLVRLRGDERPCPTTYESFEESGRLVILRARARCEALPRSLVLDWGLFSSSGLDHVSVTTLVPPYGDPVLALLSKRAPRATLRVGMSPLAKAAIGVAGLVLLSLLALVVVIFRRRRRR